MQPITPPQKCLGKINRYVKAGGEEIINIRKNYPPVEDSFGLSEMLF